MADYTPTADFEFSASGYTPTPDFDFATAITYDLAFGQSWALDAYTSADTHLSQQWEITGVTLADAAFSQQWDLQIFTYLDLSARQQWALQTASFGNTYSSHRWALSAAVFALSVADYRWAISVPAFGDVSPDFAWALDIFDYADVAGDLSWQVDAIDGVGDLPCRQKWALQATAIWTRVVSSVTYTLTLTGAADSTTDIELPMASYSSRLRSGESSYLQVSVPNARAYASEIAARQNGDLVISRGLRWSDGTVDVEEIARATLSLINTDIGAASSTVSLQARATTTNATPKTVTLTGAHYAASSGGRRRYRCAIDNSLRPGDTAIIDGDSLLVDQLAHYVSVKQGYMEIAEA